MAHMGVQNRSYFSAAVAILVGYCTTAGATPLTAPDHDWFIITKMPIMDGQHEEGFGIQGWSDWAGHPVTHVVFGSHRLRIHRPFYLVVASICVLFASTCAIGFYAAGEALHQIAGANAGFRLGLWLSRHAGVAQLER